MSNNIMKWIVNQPTAQHWATNVTKNQYNACVANPQESRVHSILTRKPSSGLTILLTLVTRLEHIFFFPVFAYLNPLSNRRSTDIT